MSDQRKDGISWTDERSGRALGALKRAATQLGIGLDVYLDNIRNGKLWCTRCKTWHQQDAFGLDASRPSGRAAACTEARRSRYVHHKRERFHRHGWLSDARDGDKKQARRRVNYLVEQRRIPHPNALPCADCGHLFTEEGPRHEYDHYLGYGANHQLDVQAVCSRCHHTREESRCG